MSCNLFILCFSESFLSSSSVDVGFKSNHVKYFLCDGSLSFIVFSHCILESDLYLSHCVVLARGGHGPGSGWGLGP